MAETKLCDLDPKIETPAISLAADGKLFAAQGELDSKSFNNLGVVTEYDASCNHLRRFGYGKIPSTPVGVAAFHNAEGDVFDSIAGPGAGIHQLAIPPPGPLIVPASVKTATVGNTKARVIAEINPEGKETKYHVDYVSQKDFEEQGFGGSKTKSTPDKVLSMARGTFRTNATEEVLLGCAVASEEAIENEECLLTETEYHYRFVASNADGEGEGPVASTFTTGRPIEIREVFATGASNDGVTANAVVNPLGIPASGYFEYVDEATYQADKGSGDGFQHALRAPNSPPQAELGFGGGEAPVRQSVALYPLAPGTTYHYRLAGIDALIDEHLFSEEKTFRTFATDAVAPCAANEAFRTGASALLPDCRAYELVSPLDKSGGDVIALKEGVTRAIGGAEPELAHRLQARLRRLPRLRRRRLGPLHLPIHRRPRPRRLVEPRDQPAAAGEHCERIAGSLDTELRALSGDLCESW